MSVQHKHYPHPVLESQFDTADENFVNSYFDVSIDVKREDNGTNMLVESIFDLTNETLKDLINSEKAIFALLFVCESTSKRFLMCTKQFEDSFNISTKSLNKTVTIQPYILAKRDINSYQNNSLVEPFKYISFDVKRGDILAIAADTEIYIEKEKLFDVDSIFEFIELSERRPKLMSFNPDNTKIQIFIPSDTFNKIKELSNYKSSINDILISLFYLPSIVYALNSIVSLNVDAEGESKLMEYKDHNWYRTLERKLIELKLGDDLSGIQEDEVNNIAHKLMEDPNYKSLLAVEDLIYGSEGSE